MKVVGNSQFQKEANCLLILNLLRRNPCSRIEISHILGLQPSTVTYSVNRLIENGTVIECAQEETGTSKVLGRRRNLLAVNPDFGRAVGIELMSSSMHITVCDLAGNVVHRQSNPCKQLPGHDDDPVVKFKALVSEAVLAAQQICAQIPILGVCMAVPGIVNDGNRFIDACWTHGLKHVDLSGFLSSFDFPVFFENDANCCAEKYLWGAGYEHDSFLYLLARRQTLSTVPAGVPTIGLGFGLVLDGKLYRGSAGRSGEYCGSHVVGDPTLGQVSLTSQQLEQMDTDPALARELVMELFSDVFCAMSIFDPRVLFVGGFLATEPYRTLVFDVLEHELHDRFNAFNCNGGVVLVQDSQFDPSEGAADALLNRLYVVPQVGDPNMASSRLNGLMINIV